MSRRIRSRGSDTACLTKVAEDKEYVRCMDCGRLERAVGARDSKVLLIGAIERLHQVQAKHGNNEAGSRGLKFRASVSTFYCSVFPIADVLCKRETANNRSNSRWNQSANLSFRMCHRWGLASSTLSCLYTLAIERVADACNDQDISKQLLDDAGR